MCRAKHGSCLASQVMILSKPKTCFVKRIMTCEARHVSGKVLPSAKLCFGLRPNQSPTHDCRRQACFAKRSMTRALPETCSGSCICRAWTNICMCRFAVHDLQSKTCIGQNPAHDFGSHPGFDSGFARVFARIINLILLTKPR
jgi:hypothetical protein